MVLCYTVDILLGINTDVIITSYKISNPSTSTILMNIESNGQLYIFRIGKIGDLFKVYNTY